jgi:hypothetical protein
VSHHETFAIGIERELLRVANEAGPEWKWNRFHISDPRLLK